MALIFSKVSLADVETLTRLSKTTFFDAFYHLNNPDDIEAYADKHLTEEKLTAELSNPSSSFFFALSDGELAGYLKLNFGDAQSDIKDPASLEIERVYVSKHQQGKQIGARLIEHAIQIATEAGLQYVWLGVWEHNTRAIKFYQQNDFEIFGSHDFMLGSDLQTDLLMKRKV